MKKFESIDEYINNFDGDKKVRLNEMRKIISSAAASAKECISYNMPAYRQKRILVQFGAGKNHIGFYPNPSAIEEFKDKLNNYKYSKGAVQFPLDKELPEALITDMVLFRVEEDNL